MLPPPPTAPLFPYTTLFRSTPGVDGLSQRVFRDGTPYSGEDLFLASAPELSARCTRDAATPGMCLRDRKSTRLNSSHRCISYAVFCLKKKKKTHTPRTIPGY